MNRKDHDLNCSDGNCKLSKPISSRITEPEKNISRQRHSENCNCHACCKKRDCDLCISEKSENLSEENERSTLAYDNYHSQRNNHNLKPRQSNKMSFCKEVKGYVERDKDDNEYGSQNSRKSNRKRAYKEVTDLTIEATVKLLSINKGTLIIRAVKSASGAVTIMWDPIQGKVGANSVKEFEILASFPKNNLPSFPVYTLTILTLNGIYIPSAFIVNPGWENPFMFKILGEINIQANDFITILGGSATWIVGHYECPPQCK